MIFSSSKTIVSVFRIKVFYSFAVLSIFSTKTRITINNWISFPLTTRTFSLLPSTTFTPKWNSKTWEREAIHFSDSFFFGGFIWLIAGRLRQNTGSHSRRLAHDSWWRQGNFHCTYWKAVEHMLIFTPRSVPLFSWGSLHTFFHLISQRSTYRR